MIKTLLWDVDGTLLDFHAAESAAVKHLFREFGLGECTDTMVSRYSAMNATKSRRIVCSWAVMSSFLQKWALIPRSHPRSTGVIS